MKIEQLEGDFVVLICVVLPVPGISGERRRRRKNTQERSREREKTMLIS